MRRGEHRAGPSSSFESLQTQQIVPECQEFLPSTRSMDVRKRQHIGRQTRRGVGAHVHSGLTISSSEKRAIQ